MLDHVGLAVSDFATSKSFFERALAPLGYKCLLEFPGAAGFGREGKADFWITQGNKSNPDPCRVCCLPTLGGRFLLQSGHGRRWQRQRQARTP